MAYGYPRRLVIGSGSSARAYRVSGTAERAPRWRTVPVPSQDGDPLRERRVRLGDGSAGIIGSHRHAGSRPSENGVADVTNGDTSVEDRYGAGPLVTTIDLSAGNSLYAAGSIGRSLTIGGASGVETEEWLPIAHVIGTDPYAAGTSIGGNWLVRNGMVNAGASTMLTGVIIHAGDAVAPDFDLYLFNGTPSSSTITDSLPIALSDADREKLVAVLTLTRPVADAAGRTYALRGLSIPIPVGANLNLLISPRSSVTFSGVNDLNISLGFIRTDLPSPAPSIGGGSISDTPTAIWSDGADGDGNTTRYIYVLAGGRTKVIDPADDSVVETTEDATVSGGSVARWAGQWWIARRGDSSDLAQYVRVPFDGVQTVYSNTDFTATHFHAGPDALYRAYNNFAGNTALIQKTDAITAATVAAGANWAPSSGETMADPGVPVTRLATLGEDLVVGKRDGLYEFDNTFTARTAIEWMRGFQWEHNCNAILPLGQAREVIVSFRRGLYYLPVNLPIGTEVLTGNQTDKKGRYTAIEYDGNWIYAFLETPTTGRSHLVKMRPRRSEGPGLFEHHPIATLENAQTLATYLWPGANIGGVSYGPRLYFGSGSDSLSYIRLGETQPDVLDSNYRFTSGSWSIQWPHDDFGSPQTPKIPYKVEASYEGVEGTPGITWSVSADDGPFVPLDADGSGSSEIAVTADGFAQRFGRRSGSISGRELVLRVSGSGGSEEEQQRMVGTPILTLLEQPEMVTAIECTLELSRDERNSDDAEWQWRTLTGMAGSIQPVVAEWGDDLPGTTFYARIGPPERTATVTSADAPGVILASLSIRALDFS